MSHRMVVQLLQTCQLSLHKPHVYCSHQTRRMLTRERGTSTKFAQKYQVRRENCFKFHNSQTHFPSLRNQYKIRLLRDQGPSLGKSASRAKPRSSDREEDHHLTNNPQQSPRMPELMSEKVRWCAHGRPRVHKVQSYCRYHQHPGMCIRRILGRAGLSFLLPSAQLKALNHWTSQSCTFV